MQDYIGKHIDVVNNIKHNSYSVLYKSDKSEFGGIAMAKANAKMSNTNFEITLKNIHNKLTRKDVFDYFKEDIYTGFISALLWGGMHKDNHTRCNFVTIAAFGKDDIKKKLERIQELLKENSIRKAFVSLNPDSCRENDINVDNNHIAGIGISYSTKLLYFLGRNCVDRDYPLIYDKYMKYLYCALLIEESPSLARQYFGWDEKNHILMEKYDYQDSADVYLKYCEKIHKVAKDCGIKEADNLEEYMFGKKKKYPKDIDTNPRSYTYHKVRTFFEKT